MLLDGVNHVATLTNDTDRRHRFSVSVFDATVSRDGEAEPGLRVPGVFLPSGTPAPGC